jgi:multiple sugar transport system permease protein
MKRARGATRRGRWSKIGTYTFLGLYSLWRLIPVAWVFLSSLKRNVDILSVPPKLFVKPTLSNYSAVPKAVPEFSHVFTNSIVVAATGTTVIVLLGVPAAYGLCRMTRIRRARLGLSIISVRAFPTIALAIPLYMLMQSANLLDTRTSVVLANVAFSLPFAVWMIYGFIQSVPMEIEEAAAIDGCGRLGTLVRVVLPSILPGVGATAILTSVVAWREFLFPLVLTQSKAQTLPVVVGDFITGQGTDWGALSAFAVITILPVALFGLVAGKYLVRGFSAGAIK